MRARSHGTMKRPSTISAVAGFLGGASLFALSSLLQQIIGGVGLSPTRGWIVPILLGGTAGALIPHLVQRSEKTPVLEDAAREREVAQTLLNTAEALSTTLRIDRLLERVLDELQRVVPYDAASIIMLQDPSSSRLESGSDSSLAAWTVASRGLERMSLKRFLLAEMPPVEQVVRERSPFIVPEMDGSAAWLPVTEPNPVRSWMGVPLICKDRVIGVLVVDSHRPDAYDEGTARLAFAFAHQAALAIENSRLYEQTRAQLREATLLHDVTVALSSTLDIEQLLPYVARCLYKILNATRVQIYSLDDAGETITVAADYVSSEAIEGERRPELGQTHSLTDAPGVAEGLSQRRPVQVQTSDPELAPRERARLEAHGAQASLLLPLLTRDHVLGCAQVWESQGPRRFTAGEIAVGQTLIQPAAIAMENARLFEETKLRVRELEFLHEVSLAAASGVRLEDTLQSADCVWRQALAIPPA